jgi:hypothetical protein
MAPGNCKLVGRWRIVEADIWDRDYLDLVEPAMMTIGDDRHGEIAFGAFQASLDIKYGRESIGFTWEGWDEGDQVSGDGSAELLDDGSIEIEFAIHKGDEAVLKAIWADQSC